MAQRDHPQSTICNPKIKIGLALALAQAQEGCLCRQTLVVLWEGVMFHRTGFAYERKGEPGRTSQARSFLDSFVN